MQSGAIKAAAWSGIAGIVLFGVSFSPLMASFLPPPSPSLDPVALSAFYRDNATGIRVGAITMTYAASLLIFFAAGISALIRRVDGAGHALAYGQFLGGTVGCVTFVFGAFMWSVGAFRHDRGLEDLQLVNDMAWTILVMAAPLGLIQLGPLTAVILQDKSPAPVFPRWLGYLSIWAMILFLPGSMMVFFKHGPFAWNGLLAFWIPAGAFAIWIIATSVVMLRVAGQLDGRSSKTADHAVE